MKVKKVNMVAAVSEEVGYALHNTISAEVGKTVAAVMTEFKESLRPFLTTHQQPSVTQPAGNQQFSSQVQRTERICYFCQNPGHIARYCKDKILDEERKRVARENGGNVPKKQPASAQTGTPPAAVGGATV